MGSNLAANAEKPKPLAGGVVVWEVATGNVVAQWTEPGSCILAVAFSPDGKRLAGACCSRPFIGADNRMSRTWLGGQVRVWDAQSGQTQQTLAWPACDWVAFSADGQRLFADRHHPRVWDFAAGSEKALLAAGEEACGVSSDGRWLAVSQPNEVIVRLRESVPGTVPRAFGHPTVLSDVVFAGDTRQAAALSVGWVIVWPLQSGAPTYTLHPHTGAVSAAAFSNDGSFLVTGGVDGLVRVWDNVRGGEPPRLRGPADLHSARAVAGAVHSLVVASS